MGRTRASFQAWLNTEYKLLREKKKKKSKLSRKRAKEIMGGEDRETLRFLGNTQSRGNTEDASVLRNTEETEERTL